MMALAGALMLAACDRHESELTSDILPADSLGTVDIRFTFGNIAVVPMTRATLSEAQLTDLWMFDYLDGSLVNTVHQSSADAGFGQVSLSADYGEHTFYFVAAAGAEPAIDGTTISWTSVKDTFWSSMSLTVSPGMAASRQVVLQRVATRLRVAVDDEVPANLAKLTLTPSHWYYGLDYITGEPVDDRSTPRSVNVPASYAGTSGNLAMAIYGICDGEGYSTDVQVTATGSDESLLADITLTGVPLQRNRVTSYSGSLFSSTRSMTVSVDDAWADQYASTW